MSYDSQTSTSLINKLRKDVDSLTLKVAVLTDSKTSGTSGGAGVAAAFTTRELNTIAIDPNGLILDLTANQFTLAAGAYQIRAMAAFRHTGHTRMRIYDVTGSAEATLNAGSPVDVIIGYSVSSEVSNQANTYIDLNLRVQPHKDNVYRLEYYISASGANHLGIPTSLTGISETFAICEITRLDTGMTKPSGGSGIQGAPGPAGPAGPAGPPGPAGSGTVTSVSVVTANGVSGSVATSTTTPAITLALGAITPTSVAASGAISAGATVTGSNLSGVNTGDQVIILSGDRMLTEGSDFLITESGDYILETGDVTGQGTGRIPAVITPQAVTYDKMQYVSATDRLLGRQSAGPGLIEEITCTAAGRALLDDASATDQRTTLGAAASGPITASGLTVSTNNRLLGRVSGGGAVEEISLGTGISFAGTVLSATGTGGTVTSTDVSGGTTGLTTSGGPIIAAGTITLAGTLAVTNGGTGAITAPLALASLGAYPASNPNNYNVGTVTNVTVTPADGITASVGTSTTTPAISLGLGAITPTSVASTGTVTGTNLSGTHSGISSGTNTGDQNIALTGPVTGTGTTTFATTITNGAVTYDKIQTTSAVGRLLGSESIGNSITEIIIGSNLSLVANTLSASAPGTGTVTSVNADGSTTGLSFTGGPVITSGTLTLGGTLALTNGGTGAISAAAALTSLGAYPANNPNGYTSNAGTVTSVDVAGGTTGLTTSGGPIAASGTITLAGTLAITNGGTGAITAPAALTALGAYPAANPSGYTANAGTVTTASVVTANGVSGTVANDSTTPAITIVLGAIVPTSVAATGTVTGSNLSGSSSGTNTGDQAIVLSGDVSGSGSTGITTTIGANKVTYGMIQAASATSRLLGSSPLGTAIDEINLGTGLSMAGNTLNATASGSGDVTGPSVAVDEDVAVFNGTTGKIIKVGATTGTGNLVRATSPNLLTPNIGTPSAGTLTNCTFPVRIQDTGITCSAARVLGRSTAGTGSVEQLTLGAGLSLSGGVLNAVGTGSGDVVGPGSSGINKIARFADTTGKLIGPGAWSDDSNDFYGVAGATTMQFGFAWIPAANGAPTGTVSQAGTLTGRVPLYYDTNSETLYVYTSSTWKPV